MHSSSSSERPPTRSRDRSVGYSRLSPVDRSLCHTPLQSAADISSSPVLATDASRLYGRSSATEKTKAESRPVITERSRRADYTRVRCGHKTTQNTDSSNGSRATAGSTLTKKPKRRPTTSAGFLLLKDYAFGTLGPCEVPQRVHSANAQQRPRNNPVRVAFDDFSTEPDQRPPSRQRPPPQALHLELPTRSLQSIHSSSAISHRRYPPPPQTSAGIRATKNRDNANTHAFHVQPLTKVTRANTSSPATKHRTAWTNDYANQGVSLSVCATSTGREHIKSPYLSGVASQSSPGTRTRSRVNVGTDTRPGIRGSRPSTSGKKARNGGATY